MKRLHRCLASLSILSLATLGLAASARAYDVTPASDPETLGFSSSRLARIAAWQQTQVDAGAFSGAVAAIARNGKVAYLRAAGFRDLAKTSPLQSDAIFWIASMTKPVTSVAAMILVEEGKLDLAAPVHKYIPEFKDTMVAVETTDPANGERRRIARAAEASDDRRGPAAPYGSGLIHGDTALRRGSRFIRSSLRAKPACFTAKDLASRGSELARLPLAHQPGEVWNYGIRRRCARTCRRSRLRSTARPISRSASVQTARHGRYRLSRCRPKKPIPPGRSAGRCWMGRRRVMARSPNRPSCSRAEAGWRRRHRTICGSARCCSTAANSMAPASSRPRP